MKNYIQPGKVITLTAPKALASGDGFKVGDLFAVAAADAENGAEVEGATLGVYELPKATTDDISLGAKLYWDDAEGEVTTDDAEGANMAVGVAIEAAGNPSSLVRVRLNGSF